MIPDWLGKILADMGVPGAIIFVLLTALIGAVAYIKSMQAKADKIYGYRLEERDTLKDALSSTAKVLGDMLDATKDRNELTEDQADLIAQQSAAFELLKVTILAQYENIKGNHAAVSLIVSAMAEAIRTLTAMVVENKHGYNMAIQDIKTTITASTSEITAAIRSGSQTVIADVRQQLGSELTIVQRRRKSPTSFKD